MDELSIDNILTGPDVENLFVDGTLDVQEKDTPPDNDPEGKEGENNTTEVNVNTLFTDKPESVGSGNDIEEKEDTDSDEGNTSPKLYSSIAKALAEEGIFPNLDEETTSKVTNSEEFKKLIEEQIKSNFDERQKRIDEALGVGVEPDAIRQYESTLNYLDSITESAITAENDEGETLRKRLIYQDFINRGYSKDRANREVQKSFNGGTDIDDAKEALRSNREFFQGSYDKLIEDAKKEEEADRANRNKQAEELKNSILNDKKVFGDLELDKATRQKVFDSIAKPIHRDPETGEMLTAIQKYEMDNRLEFLKNLGLVFTLTNGFKSLDGLVKGKVNKEVKKGFRELENTLNNTVRTSDGNLKFTSGVDSESFIGKGWTIDA